MKKGGASPTIYSSSPTGGAFGRYVIVNQFDSFAVYDGPSALQKGAGDAEYHRIQAQRNQQIEERSTLTLRRVSEMSVPADRTKPSPMILLQRVQIAPEKRKQFEALWISEVVPAVRKAGRYVSVGRVTLGGVTEYHITTGLNSYAELDKGVTAAQLSMTPDQYTAFNKLAGQANGVIRREVLRRRLDLMELDRNN